jgi:hypothetical protein
MLKKIIKMKRINNNKRRQESKRVQKPSQLPKHTTLLFSTSDGESKMYLDCILHESFASMP